MYQQSLQMILKDPQIGLFEMDFVIITCSKGYLPQVIFYQFVYFFCN